MTHICVCNLTIIGSGNGLLPGRRQAIIWTNAGLLLIGPLGTNFSEILIVILTFSFKKMHLKVSSAKRRPFCLGLNVLKNWTWECKSLIVPLRFLVAPATVLGYIDKVTHWQETLTPGNATGNGKMCSTLCTNRYAGRIPGLRPANERRRYFVTTSLIGWAQV